MAPVSRFARHIERIRTEPGLGRNVAVIAGVLALALVAGGWILSSQHFSAPWSSKFHLSAEFAEAPGIAPGHGQEVRIAGVLAGEITGAHVASDGHAVIDMALNPSYTIYDNAVLVLRSKSPLNEMYVTINPGGPPGKPLTSGTTLPVTSTRNPIEVDEVLGSLDDQSRSALTTLLQESDQALASSPTNLAGGLDATGAMLQTLKPVADELAARRANIQRLVTALAEVSQAVGGNDQRLTRLAANLETTLNAVSDEHGSLGQTLAELPSFTKVLGSSTAAVQQLAAQLNPTLTDLKNASGVLPQALAKLSDTAGVLQQTVAKLGPVARQAVPVFADLRPVVAGFATSLPALRTVTATSDPVTQILQSYLPDIAAFMVNTESVTAERDGNGGMIRGQVIVTNSTFPTN